MTATYIAEEKASEVLRWKLLQIVFRFTYTTPCSKSSDKE